MTQRTLADLTPRDRSILRLCRDETLRLPEIAVKLNMSLDRLYRRMRQLREWGFAIPSRTPGTVGNMTPKRPSWEPSRHEADIRRESARADSIFAAALLREGYVRVQK